MATRTDRILARLPRTFRALPPPTALHALADAFGGELQRAENALAEVLQSHWVDHADRGADAVHDLAAMAALYGLAPRAHPLPEETVEEFRARLKSHVRAFLEGTSTLGGVLRVAADALGLRTEEALDGWWNRAGGDPVLTRPRGDDAAALLFGVPAALARGHAATPARVRGPVLPAEGADLRRGATLRLSVDGGEAREVDCAAGAEDRARVPLGAIAAAVNAVLGAETARDEDGRLVLRSPSAGAASRLEVHEAPGDDAAPVLLGLPARRHVGRAGEDARIVGQVELADSMDLRDARYLRLTVDGTRLAEVDCCAGADPAATTPAQVAEALNAALGPVATIEAGRLVLASATPGAGGSLVVREAAAQDAARRLLGDAPRSAEGRDPAPAEAAGAAVLPGTLDLGGVFAVRVAVDGRRPVTVDCAGADPAATTPAEVAARLAAALAPGTAWFDGAVLHVASGTAGPESTLELLPVAAEEDAAPLLFGLRPRVFAGEDAAPAVIHGTRDLGAGADVRARGSLGVAVDGAPPVEVDLAGAVADPRRATAAELARAVNEALGEWVAAAEGDRLVLASNTRGTAAAVELVPLEEREQRPFVTRAFVAGEAASVLLGMPTASAAGTAAERARLAGTRDLRRGVDLRPARWLRLAVDGAPAVEVDCAARSARPRAALPAEIVQAINEALATDADRRPVAWLEGGHLVLASRREGSAAAVRLEPPRAEDARPLVLGREPGLWRGVDGRRVVFAGTADLGAGVDLAAARHLRLNVDGVEREVDCAGTDPAATALPEVVAAVNTAFGRLVARSDGAHLVVSSAGPDGTVEILSPAAGPDAAPALLGIHPPRAYRGSPPRPAEVRGTAVLAGPLDLSVRRFLRIAVDGGAPLELDGAARVVARTPDPAALADALRAVSPMDVVDALNDALGPGVAALEDGRLVLRTRSTGSGARIELLAYTGADARGALLGDAPAEARGMAPAAARIEGTVELLAGADLSSGRTLRIRVDGGRARDVDAGGVLAGRTEADEVVAAINRALPGLASLTEDGRLRLASPTAGPASALEVLPVRVLEVVEYPARAVADPPRSLRHGTRTAIVNDGAHESDAVLEIRAPRGASGPALADPAAGTRIRYRGALGAGDTLRLARHPALGVRGELLRADGSVQAVPPDRLLAGSAGAQAQVPFDGARRLTRGRPGEPAALRLDDPWQPRVVLLRERTPAAPEGLEVEAVEHALGAPAAPPAAEGRSVTLHGRVTADGGRHLLVDRDGGVLAALLRGTSGGAARHLGRVVAAEGALHASADGAPVLVARRIDRLFDVTVRRRAPGTAAETFAGVSLGSSGEDGLVRRAVAGASRSALVVATDEDRGALLRLARGAVEWVYTECHGARFDAADFEEAGETELLRTRFPGAGCVEMGILDVSRFAENEDDPGAAALAAGPGAAPPVSLVVRWTRHLPGAFELRLPAELPEPLGARLDDARLGRGPLPGPPSAAPPPLEATHEVYGGVVTEPAGDPDHLLARLAQSRLVTVSVVSRAPIGWRAVPIPFRRPRVLRLSGGRDDRPARIYVVDPDVPVVFEILAKAGENGGSAAGAWGNRIEIGVGPWVPDDGVPGVDPPVPGRFQVVVGLVGARIEGARAAVRGGVDVPPPGPVGVLHARAAGVAARVVRERAEFAALENDRHPTEEPA